MIPGIEFVHNENFKPYKNLSQILRPEDYPFEEKAESSKTSEDRAFTSIETWRDYLNFKINTALRVYAGCANTVELQYEIKQTILKVCDEVSRESGICFKDDDLIQIRYS